MIRVQQIQREWGIQMRNGTGRYCGIWSDNQVIYRRDHTSDPIIRRYNSRAQAISLAHRWCQGYDV